MIFNAVNHDVDIRASSSGTLFISKNNIQASQEHHYYTFTYLFLTPSLLHLYLSLPQSITITPFPISSSFTCLFLIPSLLHLYLSLPHSITITPLPISSSFHHYYTFTYLFLIALLLHLYLSLPHSIIIAPLPIPFSFHYYCTFIHRQNKHELGIALV